MKFSEDENGCKVPQSPVTPGPGSGKGSKILADYTDTGTGKERRVPNREFSQGASLWTFLTGPPSLPPNMASERRQCLNQMKSDSQGVTQHRLLTGKMSNVVA